MLHLEYFAHACFMLHLGGRKVLIDPYSPQIGHKWPERPADLVLVSHEHEDHNYVAGVSGRTQVLRGCASRQWGELKIRGVLAHHGGSALPLTLFCLRQGQGPALCHLADLGQTLEPEQVEEIGACDVLLVPVGGAFTLDAAGALQVVRQLQPKVVIPMHYRTPFLCRQRFPALETSERFLREAARDYRIEKVREGELRLEKLPEATTIFPLPHLY